MTLSEETESNGENKPTPTVSEAHIYSTSYVCHPLQTGIAQVQADVQRDHDKVEDVEAYHVGDVVVQQFAGYAEQVADPHQEQEEQAFAFG